MKNRNYKTHVFFCVALFTAGNFIIKPSDFKSEGFLPLFLISAFANLSVAVLSAVIFNKVFNSKVQKNFAICAVSVYIAAVTVCCIIKTASEYINFLKTVQMPNTERFIITVAVLFLIFAFSFCKTSAILKYGLITAVLSVFGVLLLFSATSGLFDFSNIKSGFKFGKNDICNSLKNFTPVFLSVPAAFSVFANKKEKPEIKNTLFGVIFGVFAAAICLVQTVAVLGISANVYDCPYITSVSVFSGGSLFTRLDGIAYYIFFGCASVRFAICVNTLVCVIKIILKKYKKRRKS